MTIQQVENVVLDVLKDYPNEQLSAESIKNKCHKVNLRSYQKRKVIEQAIDNLFDQGKIKREYGEQGLFFKRKIYKYFL
jgi:mannitol/fructose-specific phosphotransferase system IIA component (Ntr-type)